MTFLFTVQTILEVLAVAFFVWGIFNEKKLIRFEERVVCAFRRKGLKLISSGNERHKHCA